MKGVVTSTRGAALSVEPVTSTLPVRPVSVHSGVPLSGAVDGQTLAGDAGVVAIWVTDAELGCDDSVLELHAESVTREAAAAARAMGATRRGEFTA